MSLEIDSILLISFQYHYPIAYNLIRKIYRSIIENTNVEFNPGLHSFFQIPGNLPRKLEPFLWGFIFAQMNGYVNITKVVSLDK